MPKKVIRDKNAPRRNLSAYLLYQNAMRDEFRAQYPKYSFGELSKLTSQMYSSLTPQEREMWQHRAEEDKARYLDEMSRYIPPPGYDAKGEAIIPKNPREYSLSIFGNPSKVKKTKCKDPNAPKRNLSSYLLYQNAMRDQFKSDNPGMTFGQLSSYTSYMYKSLTVEEKGQWERRAIQDKERYEEEMSRYAPPPGFDRFGVLIDNHPATIEAKKAKKVRDPNAPKRARGSYVFFTNYMRPIILKERPETKFIELGTIMGQRWRNMSVEEKKKFEDLAHEDRNRFNREMEAYDAKKEEKASTENFTLLQINPADQNQVYEQDDYDQSIHQQYQHQQQPQQQHVYFQQQDQMHQHQQMNQNHFQSFDPLQATSSPNSTAFQPIQIHQDQMYGQPDQYQPILENSVPFDVSHAFDDHHLEPTQSQYSKG